MESPPQGAVLVQLNSMRNASQIWASEARSPNMSKSAALLLAVEESLSSRFRSKRQEHTISREEGEFVAVRSVEDDSKWHRGKILHLFQLRQGLRYQVELIDYGNQMRVKPAHLHSLPVDLLEKLPPQAMLLQLYGIVPLSYDINWVANALENLICEHWTPAAEKLVDDIMRSCRTAFFIEKTPIFHGTSSLNIKYGDVLVCITRESQELISLSNELCSKGFALKCESEFSKRHSEVPPSTVQQAVSNNSRSSPPVASVSTSSPQRSNTTQKAMSMLDFIAAQEAKKKTSEPLTSLNCSAPSCPGPTIAVNAASETRIKGHGASSPLSGSEDSGPSKDEKSLSDSSTSEGSKLSKSTRSNPLAAVLNALQKPSGTRCSITTSSVKPSADVSPSKSNAVASSLAGTGESSKNKSPPEQAFVKRVQSRRIPVPDDEKIVFLPAGIDVGCEVTSSSSSNRAVNFKPKGGGWRQKAEFTSDSDTSDSGKLQNRNPTSNTYQCEGGYQSGSSSGTSSHNLPKSGSRPAIGYERKAISEVSQHNPLKISGRPNAEYDGEPSSSDASLHENVSAIPPSVGKQNAPPGYNLSRVRSEEVRVEKYLERRVLLHGGLPPRPWMSSHDMESKFSHHIEQILTKMKWNHNIFTIEKFVWPAVRTRQNIVMVSGAKSGKTSSYVIPLMDFMCDVQITKGNGPLVLILCSGCKAVKSVYQQCVTLLNGSKSKVRTYQAYGLALEEEFMLKMVNGCEVLITTPLCFLRLMKMRLITNLYRLCHFVLDEADILLTKLGQEIKEIQRLVVVEQARRTEAGDPIQVIVSCEKWSKHLLFFTSHLRSNPIVCINDCLEASVYGGADAKLHTVSSDKKASHLIDLLSSKMKVGLMKTVVVCNTEEEVNILQKFFENQCFNCLTVKPSDQLVQIETYQHVWNCSSDGQHYILLCTDSEIPNLAMQDAMCLIHYSLPPEDKSLFMYRFCVIMGNLKNMFDNKTNFAPPQVHIYVDENDLVQLPVITHFLLRLQVHVDENVLKTAKDISLKKEQKKKDKPLCGSVKMFGDCWNKSSCPNRHMLCPDLDSPIGLPHFGEVSLKILKVHNACHFSVRILNYTNSEGAVQKFSSDYLKVAIDMSEYFSASTNRMKLPDVNVGCICAVETAENLFQRVLVLNIEEKDHRKRAVTVQVQYLEDGTICSRKASSIYYLPEQLQRIPPQAIDLFVCNLLPCDSDESWNEIATRCVRDWVENTELDDDAKIFKGQIVFSLRGALWVDPLNIMKFLPHTKTYVSVRNVRRSLLQDQHALENPGHLKKLYALCAEYDCFVLPPNAFKEARVVKRPLPQPKPAWAFLEAECFNAVDFSATDSLSCFFVRRKKFSSLLERILDDIGDDVSQRKNKQIPVLEPGYICLARHSTVGTWNRAQVLAIYEDDTIHVFYVDYGDRDVLKRQDTTTIPDWAITRLPFQAIECRMIGVSSVDDVNILHDITEDGTKLLQAKVCEKSSAECTGGSRFGLVLVDPSSIEPLILNKEILERYGAKPIKEELEYIDLNLEECKESFEKSSGEEDDSDQEDESNLPVSNQPDSWGLSDTAFEPTYASSGTGRILPELDDNGEDDIVTINGYKVNMKEIDMGPALDFIKGIKPKEKMALSSEQPKKAICYPSNSNVALPPQSNTNGEGGHERPLRVTLPLLSSARPPLIKWYEDLYHVWVKVCITGVTKYFLRWTATRIQFSSSVNGKNYHFDQELRGTIYPADLVTNTSGFWVLIKLRKACSGLHWKRLFASKRKYAWVSVDYDANADSSDDTDSNIHPTIETYNRSIKKLPIQQRRQRRRPKDGPALPDYSDNDDSGSSHDADLIDPDLMF